MKISKATLLAAALFVICGSTSHAQMFVSGETVKEYEQSGPFFAPPINSWNNIFAEPKRSEDLPGFKITAAVVPATIRLRKHVKLELTVRNTGTKELYVYPWPASATYEVCVENVVGNLIWIDPVVGFSVFRSSAHPIKPKQEQVDRYDLKGVYGFCEPGTYRITVAKYYPETIDRPDGTGKTLGNKGTYVVSNTVELKVTE